MYLKFMTSDLANTTGWGGGAAFQQKALVWLISRLDWNILVCHLL